MLTLVLAFHNHQPVGNFEHVIREAVERCYRPVLDELGRHPGIRAGIHHSGPLLDWLEQHEPSYLADLTGLVRRGQLEVIGGAYYEPILSVLPTADALGQIRWMEDYWFSRAGVRPRGVWLAERIWDPSLPALLAQTAAAYTLLDDTHFRYAGNRDPLLSGYFLTERAGAPLAIFPIDKELRYRIPFHMVPELIAYLRELAPQDLTLTYGDDGEKFGVWPGTHEWVIEKGWLRDFFTALEESRDAIETVLPDECRRTRIASGRIYLPTASYEEMLAWALPTDAARELEAARAAVERLVPEALPFLRGGLWENFFVKYPESNHMHKRMLGVSRRLAAAEAEGAPPAVLAAARRELYQAQCNCPYWHGLFGGLYLNHLRHATYERLIAADQLLDGVAQLPGIAVEDLDYDGEPEVRLESRELVAIVKPNAGGSLVELDLKSRRFNLLNTLARWRESYHPVDGADQAGAGSPPEKADKERKIPDELRAALVFDRLRRAAFLEHLLPTDTSFDQLRLGATAPIAEPAGERFAIEQASAGEVELLWRGKPPGRDLELRKSYRLGGDGRSVEVDYALGLASGDPLAARFAVEINFTLLTASADDRFARIDGTRESLATIAATSEVASAGAVDEAFGFTLELSAGGAAERGALWRFPVETVSRTEAGFERAYQGNAWYWSFPVELAPGAEPIRFSLRLAVAPTTRRPSPE
jgi:alpha-amylase